MVTEVPAACPRCGSLNREHLRSDTRPLGTMMLNGAVHQGIILQRVRCKDCDRHYMVRKPLRDNSKTPRPAKQGQLAARAGG